MFAALRLCLPVAVLSLAAALAAGEARAARLPQDSPGTTTLTVTVALAGARAGGDVGCALFAGPKGFPLDSSSATAIWQPAQSAMTCRFEGLAPGVYAVAVSHDLNGNRKTDRNFVGVPREAWGVSNNVRPSMRAPRFEEAALRIAGGTVEIGIEVRK